MQQHFSLIGKLTVAENLVLGRGSRGLGARWLRPLDLRAAERRALELSRRLGFGIDPSARCERLSVGARQKVEILKALWGGATTLILDEPTAALSPPDAEELYGVLETLRREGKTIVLISHKMPEIIRLCDRVTVLRDGAVVGEEEIHEGLENAGVRQQVEARLVRLMIGRHKPEMPSRASGIHPTVLSVRGLADGDRLGPVDLDVRGGEIVAVVGVEGNGQSRLVDLLTGIGRPSAGSNSPRRPGHHRARHAGPVAERHRSHPGGSPRARRRRRHDGRGQRHVSASSTAPLSPPAPFWLSRRRRSRFAEQIVRRHKVRAASIDVPVASLSGGNQQKLVVGRELARAPRLMIAAQPTRGLDIGSTAAVHQALVDLGTRGRRCCS